jgi:hypothetical protein
VLNSRSLYSDKEAIISSTVDKSKMISSQDKTSTGHAPIKNNFKLLDELRILLAEKPGASDDLHELIYRHRDETALNISVLLDGINVLYDKIGRDYEENTSSSIYKRENNLREDLQRIKLDVQERTMRYHTILSSITLTIPGFVASVYILLIPGPRRYFGSSASVPRGNPRPRHKRTR